MTQRPAPVPNAAAPHPAATALAWILGALLAVTTVALAVMGAVLLARGDAGRGSVELRTINVFMYTDATQSQIDGVGRTIKDSSSVQSSTFVTRQQAYENFKSAFKDQPDIVNSVGPGALPVGYEVIVKKYDQLDPFVTNLKVVPGVDDVVRRDQQESAGFPQAKAKLVEQSKHSVSYRTLGWVLLAVAGGFLVVGIIVLSILLIGRKHRPTV